MLSERQIDIVVFLINAEEWVTSDRLSENFHLNKKTIQAEIKEISMILDSGIIIVTNKHHGYRIENITENGLNRLILELNHYEKKNCLPPRQSAFILYLMFLRSYITMQNLAEVFFMSKTAVSLEINVIKRWIERYEGISLEISNKNGIIIHASEEKKRIYCSKHGTVRAFKELPLPDEIKKKYEDNMIKIRQIMVEACLQWNYILTGEELQKITQFLASSIIRSGMGYIRPEEKGLEITEPILNYIQGRIDDLLHYQMSQTELSDLLIIWKESNVLSDKTASNIEISDTLVVFMKKIFQVISIEYCILESEYHEFEAYIQKMKLRYKSGDIAINHYNEDIVLRYPLEAYLAYRYFSEYFSLKVTKETSFIALFLSTFLNSFKHLHSILLVSNQNISVVNSLKNILGDISRFSIENKFHVISVYQYQQEPTIRSSYDILLTTDQKTVLSDHNFFLVSPIISKEETLYLQQYMHRRLEKKEEIIKKEILNCCINNYNVSNIIKNEMSVNTIIGMEDCLELSYHTYENDQLYIGYISPKATTGIHIYHLKEPVLFRYKKIKRIVFASFHEGDDNIFLFFDAVSDILHHKS